MQNDDNDQSECMNQIKIYNRLKNGGLTLKIIDNLTQILKEKKKIISRIFTVSAPLGWTPGSGLPKTLFKPLLKKSIAINTVFVLFGIRKTQNKLLSLFYSFFESLIA